jgi:hypothetical protein
MIQTTGSPLLHWNYFLALERDLEVCTRYVEFSDQNKETYSIEFAHLLFAAASEVDVIAKILCNQVAPTSAAHNINDYRSILCAALPSLPNAIVEIPRYRLNLTPWDNWIGTSNPDWWGSYNKVKHQRNDHFDEATLKNALNSLAALLLLTFHHYSIALAPPGQLPLDPKNTTDLLKPASTLLRLPDDFYRGVFLRA